MKKFISKYSHWFLLSPYLIFFYLFIVVPIIVSVGLSFTNFNAVQFPKFTYFKNYITLFTQDTVFMQKVLPNTIIFSLIVGPGGYVLSFLLAWCVAQFTKVIRTILAIILYSPSMTSGVIMTSIWTVLFSGDQAGYLNSLLMKYNIISQPVLWLQNGNFLMPIMIIVALWSSMGVGFLAMLAGILNVDKQLYEAAYIDGVSNRFQEIIYITIPSSRSTMLFGAVMAIVNSFNAGSIGVALSGSNPTPKYAGQLIVNHIDDYGFIRYEMGYAAAASVVLLLFIWFFTKVSYKLFGDT